MEAATHRAASYGRGRVIGRGLAGSNHAGLVLAIVALCAFFTYKSPYFLNADNFANIGVEISYGGIMAAGFVLVMVAGGIDLSISGVASLSGQGLAFALTHGWGTIPSIAFALLIGAGCGLCNALLIVGIGINAIVGTIATQFLFRGLAFAWGGGGVATTSIANALVSTLADGKWHGIPNPTIVMVAIFVIVGGIYRFTLFGSNLLAAGGSRTAARRAGINVKFTMGAAYVVCSLGAALAGVVVVGLDGGSVADSTLGIEVTVLAALIIGGNTLGGGVGSVGGALLGVFGLGVLANGLNLLGVSSYLKSASVGVALLLSVALDSVRRRRRIQRDE